MSDRTLQLEKWFVAQGLTVDTEIGLKMDSIARVESLRFLDNGKIFGKNLPKRDFQQLILSKSSLVR